MYIYIYIYHIYILIYIHILNLIIFSYLTAFDIIINRYGLKINYNKLKIHIKRKELNWFI